MASITRNFDINNSNKNYSRHIAGGNPPPGNLAAWINLG